MALVLLLLATLLIFSWDTPQPSRGQEFSISMQVCRSWVEPCQQVLALPRGGATTLDLRLQAHGSGRVELAAWETHLNVTNSQNGQVVLEPTNDGPVREQGDGNYALNGLARVEDGTDGQAGRYFTVQNRYDPASNTLDYSVTLVDFAKTGQSSSAITLTGGDSLILGRITLNGVAEGSVSITAAAPPAGTSQFVILGGNNRVSNLHTARFASPLAAIHLGATSASADLHGQITPQFPADGPDGSWPTRKLTVSFWEAGAIPPWRQGDDSPLATFSNLFTDHQGRFRVSDISPDLPPVGVYDLRVWAPGTLASIVPGIILPSPGSPPLSRPHFWVGVLRGGDTDANNVVNHQDLATLKASFGALNGANRYNKLADLDGNGGIDGIDFSRMARNLGQGSQ